MNKKYERYIDYIVNELEPPYFKNMKDNYGLSPNEYELVLSKIFNQPVTIEGYKENSNGFWVVNIFDNQDNIVYFENSNGYWEKKEYDKQGNLMVYKDSDGEIVDWR